MSDLRKAAEMALKALEELRFANAPFLDEAMEALRQALAQPEQNREAEDQLAQENDGCPTEKSVLQRFWRGQEIPKEHYPSWFLYAKPVDTVKQEPVLWRYRTVTFWDSKPRWRYLESLDGTEGLLGLEPLYTAPLSIEAAVKAERNRCLKVLSDLHNDSKNNHNYYAYAAMRINEVEA